MSNERTNEFLTTCKLMLNKPQYMNNEFRLRKINGNSSTNYQINQNYSKFMLSANSIFKEFLLTYQKLSHLNDLTGKKSMFDTDEINQQLNELAFLIKQNISSLNQKIEQLRIHQSNYISSSKNVELHSKIVVLNLQERLATISNDLTNTLKIRSQDMQQQKLRQQQFSSSPYSLANTQSSAGSKLKNRSNTVINFDNQDDQTQVSKPLLQKQALLFENSTEYIEERSSTMHSIESTIVELGTIFNELATMVQHQQEMITRIDGNIADANLNVEAAHESLLRYFHTISSNRWLIIKVFGVLFFFFVIFALFS